MKVLGSSKGELSFFLEIRSFSDSEVNVPQAVFIGTD
jgi:hypothetical protein